MTDTLSAANSNDKGTIADAKTRIGDAFETTSEIVGAMVETAFEAVKERPIAAAAIGAGVAATIAGAAVGANHLRHTRKPASKPSKR
ncbi:hypothetical protein EAH79_04305 [Sphingomonas koreensis]|nr:hypothetical protein EAH79_04305 [Sphingomonas koreensis]